MSAIRKGILPAALMLAFVVGSVLPAAARPGIWVYLRNGHGGFSINLINLTSYRLVITENSFNIGCNNLQWRCDVNQSYPFQGSGVIGTYGTLYLEPYRTTMWLSRNFTGTDTSYDGYWRWGGHFKVQPEPSNLPVPDTQAYTSPYWVTVNMHTEDTALWSGDAGRGTWVYLQTDFDSEDWSQDFNAFSPQGIWVAPDFLVDYAHPENVMTLASNDFIVSLYAADRFHNDTQHITLVFRQNGWVEDTGSVTTDEYKGWPLRFADTSTTSMPDP
jgi:hypothetical protein